MIRVLHTSDLHGHHKRLLAALDQDFDVWVDTGDFFPTKGRVRTVNGYSIDPHREAAHQFQWFRAYKKLGPRIAERLAGRPAIVCAGNHDFAPLGSWLRDAGAEAADITTDGVDVAGLRWAGFREVPPITGEWAGEVPHDRLWELTLHSVAREPDVLVTHVPPHGVLDDGWGGRGMVEAVEGSSVRCHLFGHVHEHGGETARYGDVLAFNGATRAMVRCLRMLGGHVVGL